MALRNILKVDTDEKKLRRISREVKEINDRLIILLEDLKETLYHANGLGLAAPQVGILKRVAVVIDAETEDYYELINPVIVESEGVVSLQEGCLSIPEVYVPINRPERVVVKSLTRDGSEVFYEGKNMLARAFCHEIDHLNGILFLDLFKESKDDSANL